MLYLVAEVLFAAFSAGIFVYLLVIVRRRRRSGRVLLDLGKPPYPAWAVFGAIFALLGLAELAISFSGDHHAIFERFFALAYLALAAAWVMLGMAHIQWRERGLWQGIDLLRWEEINWYAWSTRRPNLLLISAPGSPGPRRIAVQVPQGLRLHVEALLEQRLPERMAVSRG